MSSDIHDPNPSDRSAAPSGNRANEVLPGVEPNDDTTQTVVGLPPALLASNLISLDEDWQTEKTVISSKPPLLDLPNTGRNSSTLGEMLVGTSLDHYELVEFVGGGGMGAVFRALDTRLGRTVAVKVLSRDHNDEETIRRFRNEAQSAARLDHPNIARVHYVGEALGLNYIVFEFIEGTNARDWVNKHGPLSLSDCLRLTFKMAEALEHASQREVVHRDIKPSNILITADGHVKLVDMGLARLHQMEASTDDLTESGVTLGTFDYISPEQARDPRLADVRSDIYSLGCTLFFFLTGQPPFPEGTALQKLLKHNGDEPPNLRDFRDDIPDRVVRILNKMLAKRPAQRFQSAAELAVEVARAAEEVGVLLEVPYGNQPAPLNNQWQRWLTSLAISVPVAVMLLLVLGMDWFMPTTQATVHPLRPQFAPHDVVTEEGNPLSSEANPAQPATGKEPAASNPTIATADVTPADKGDGNTKTEDGSRTKSAAPPGTLTETQSPADKTPAKDDTTTGDTVASASPSSPINDSGSKPTSPTVGSPREGMGITKPRTFSKVLVRKIANPSEGIVDQMAAAVKLAVEKNLTEIELQFDGPQIERPFVIPNRELIIRAGSGFHPVVVFRPTVGSLSDEQRMLRLDGSGVASVQFQGVEFRMELPSQSSSLGWSLFALGQVRTLNLEDCIVTIINQAAGGGTLHYPVSTFEILPPRLADTMMEGKAMMPTTTLQLNRTIVRGEAQLVSMQEEMPLDFAWQDGMLAISESAIASQGAITRHKGFGRIDVRWEHVAAYLGNGLYQLHRRDEATYQLDLNVRCDHCLLRWGEDAALFDFQNGPQVNDVRLQFDGLENAYADEDDIFLRVHPKSVTSVEFPLRDRNEWSSERGGRFDLLVANDTVEKQLPLHQWQVSDMAVVDENAYLGIGCDPARLPIPYVSVSAAAAKRETTVPEAGLSTGVVPIASPAAAAASATERD